MQRQQHGGRPPNRSCCSERSAHRDAAPRRITAHRDAIARRGALDVLFTVPSHPVMRCDVRVCRPSACLWPWPAARSVFGSGLLSGNASQTNVPPMPTTPRPATPPKGDEAKRPIAGALKALAGVAAFLAAVFGIISGVTGLFRDSKPQTASSKPLTASFRGNVTTENGATAVQRFLLAHADQYVYIAIECDEYVKKPATELSEGYALLCAGARHVGPTQLQRRIAPKHSCSGRSRRLAGAESLRRKCKSSSPRSRSVAPTSSMQTKVTPVAESEAS